jgi:regulator of sirC expression with transglutaminase-like and TPR domain
VRDKSVKKDLVSALVAATNAPGTGLADATLVIARIEYPRLDPEPYLAKLDSMGEAARRTIAEDGAATGDASTAAGIRALNSYLFETLHFVGNRDKYEDPRNSCLNEVLDRRTGIPITLSTVYIEVGRRAGIAVEGVGLPGHFVVRAEGRLVDPFHGGQLLSEDDCQKRLDRIYGGRLKLDEQMLAACDRKAILARTLRNLKAIYTKVEDYPRALSVVDLLLGLEPGALEELRDRGLLHAALDCYALAAGELDDYLRKAGPVPGAEQLREKIDELRARAARVN